MKYRLKWFDEFTIFQLERLAFGYQLEIDIDEYKKDFWDLIVRNRSELGINNLEFMKLQNLTLKYSDHKQETYQEMMEHFNEIYFEAEGYFDGSKTDKAKEVLNNATTLSEIRSLGKKYGVEIPRRITKKQLVDIVSIKLELPQEKEEEISKKSILDIERYAKRHDVNVSIELKKADMIEYILIKKPNKTEKKYANSMKVFKGMDVEEYLYTIKFEEIANRVKEHKSARIKRALIIFTLITIIGILGYYTLVTYIL
ncbi:MAG: hypothetical protein K9L74_00815 [Candidatus Izimaplasma sp.]|nr:hypothetical protein [Candidatus Izimaplasma bacterium]